MENEINRIDLKIEDDNLVVQLYEIPRHGPDDVVGKERVKSTATLSLSWLKECLARA